MRQPQRIGMCKGLSKLWDTFIQHVMWKHGMGDTIIFLTIVRAGSSLRAIFPMSLRSRQRHGHNNCINMTRYEKNFWFFSLLYSTTLEWGQPRVAAIFRPTTYSGGRPGGQERGKTHSSLWKMVGQGQYSN